MSQLLSLGNFGYHYETGYIMGRVTFCTCQIASKIYRLYVIIITISQRTWTQMDNLNK